LGRILGDSQRKIISQEIGKDLGQLVRTRAVRVISLQAQMSDVRPKGSRRNSKGSSHWRRKNYRYKLGLKGRYKRLLPSLSAFSIKSVRIPLLDKASTRRSLLKSHNWK
jgi:hypothetical protein